jgi:hypothetical protein
MDTNDTTSIERPSPAWVMFGYISFAAALVMVGAGILFLPLDWWVKGYFAMAALLLIQACFTLAKSLRDVHEAGRFINRLESARTERLLREA